MSSTGRRAIVLFVTAALVLTAADRAAAAEWKAGVARVNITPARPLRMAGYAARTTPSEGTLHALWAKALALEDAEGRRAVLVTMDLCGIDRELSRRVCERIQEKHRLPRAAIALCASHTHTGPVVGENLRAMLATLDEEQRARISEYTNDLAEKLVTVAGAAIASLKPARLEWGAGRATFAVNRRNNREEDVILLREQNALKGPVDHDLPVLAIRDADDGALVAVMFGYACHATTLSFSQWSGDWPGFAQLELEKSHPGAIALFWAGCGADQNPLPRRTVQLAQDYGRQAARGVEDVLKNTMTAVRGALVTKYSEIDLPFAQIPTREQLQQDTAAKDPYVASRAKLLRASWERDGGLSATYPYPTQVWRLGDGPTLVLLGGEVVVDYALRLKKELAPGSTWVAAYANDVMAYIPSERVLQEGGYEGGGAMVYYGLPSPWKTGIEELIVSEVLRLARED